MQQVKEAVLGSIMESFILKAKGGIPVSGQSVNDPAFGKMFQKATRNLDPLQFDRPGRPEEKKGVVSDKDETSSVKQAETSKSDEKPTEVTDSVPSDKEDEKKDEIDAALMSTTLHNAQGIIEMQQTASVSDLETSDDAYARQTVKNAVDDTIKSMDMNIQQNDQQIVGVPEDSYVTEAESRETGSGASEQAARTPESINVMSELPEEVTRQIKDIQVRTAFEDANNLVAEEQLPDDGMKVSETEEAPAAEVGVNDEAEQAVHKSDDETEAQPAEKKQQFTIKDTGHNLGHTVRPTVSAAAETVKMPQDTKQAVISDISDRMANMVQKGKDELSIQMKPDFLGNLSIKLTMSKEGIVARLQTENIDAKNLINGQMVKLEQTLRDKGINVVEMEVVYQEMAESANSETQHQGQHQQQNRFSMIGGGMDIGRSIQPGYDFSSLETGLTGYNNSVEFTA